MSPLLTVAFSVIVVMNCDSFKPPRFAGKRALETVCREGSTEAKV